MVNKTGKGDYIYPGLQDMQLAAVHDLILPNVLSDCGFKMFELLHQLIIIEQICGCHDAQYILLSLFLQHQAYSWSLAQPETAIMATWLYL